MTRKQRVNNGIALRLVSISLQWALLAFILMAALSSARAQSTVEMVGATSSGDPIVSINGTRHIAFTVEQVKQINDKLDRLDQLEKAIVISQRLSADYEARLGTAIKQGDGWKALFDTEHQLRLDMQQFQKRPSRIAGFFDRWYIKLLIATAPTIIGLVRRCN